MEVPWLIYLVQVHTGTIHLLSPEGRHGSSGQRAQKIDTLLGRPSNLGPSMFKVPLWIRPVLGRLAVGCCWCLNMPGVP